MKKFIVIILVFFSLLPLIHNSIALFYNCLNVYDFGIYQQAIYEIANWNNLNPYLTLRNIFVFFEHFDPIIFLATPFIWISNFNPISLIIIEWVCFLFLLIFTLIKLTPTKELKEILFALFVIIFSRSILSGMNYPIHPTTWAIVPLFLIIYFHYNFKHTASVISSIALVFFNETFAFGLVTFSFSFLLQKKYRHFLALFFISTFFVLFELKLRKLWLGNTFQYGNAFLANFLSAPIEFFKAFDYKSFFKVFIPYIIPIVFLIRSEIKIHKFYQTRFFGVILFLLPLLAIHFIINRFYFHHANKFGVVLSAALIFGEAYKSMRNKKVYLYATIILFVATSSSIITNQLKFITGNRNNKCSISNEKIKITNDIKLYFLKQDLDSIKIWSTGGIAINILRPSMKIYHGLNYAPQEMYTHLILERNNTGNAWPLSAEEVEKIIQKCSPYAISEIKNDSFFYLAEGKFPQSCVMP